MNKPAGLILISVILGLNACAEVESTDKDTQRHKSIEAQMPVKQQEQIKPQSALEKFLARLADKAAKLQSMQAKIEYTFIQDPELIEAVTVRKGWIYYRKNKTGSKLKVNFDTLKQDEADEEKRQEHFIFDGVWLTKIDYQLKKADVYQQTPEDKPLDVFEFVSHNFPVIGFTKVENLRANFDISLAEAADEDPNEPVKIHLTPKRDSAYRKDYRSIDFHVKSTGLIPLKVEAISDSNDICEIIFSEVAENRPVLDSVFDTTTPADFSREVHLLKQQ